MIPLNSPSLDSGGTKMSCRAHPAPHGPHHQPHPQAGKPIHPLPSVLPQCRQHPARHKPAPPRPLQSSLVGLSHPHPALKASQAKPAPAHCSLKITISHWGRGTGVGLGVGAKEAHAGDHTSETQGRVGKFLVLLEKRPWGRWLPPPAPPHHSCHTVKARVSLLRTRSRGYLFPRSPACIHPRLSC